MKPLKALHDLFKNPYYIALGRVQGKTRLYKDIRIIEKALKDYEELKKCLYVGKSGAIAITSYGFENRGLLEKILK